MKKQTDRSIKAQLLRSALYLLLLVAVCVIPFAFAQRNGVRQSRQLQKPLAPSNTITVTNTNDTGPGSLRQALADASDGDSIDFDSSLNGQTITLTTGELLVGKSVTISGPGADSLAVSGNAASRAFYITPGKTVTISGLTITNGSDGGYGGGIYNDHAILTVSNCTVTASSASDYGNGGGIYNDGRSSGSATLTVGNSLLSGNRAGIGGGIYNDGTNSGSATLTISNSTVTNNWAQFNGGGARNDGSYSGSATLTISNSTLSGNSTYYNGSGGGVRNDALNSGSAMLTISNSTLSSNSAGYFGGGIFNSATLTISNSTLSGNSASIGGGVFNTQAGAAIEISNTVLQNTAGSVGNIYNDSGGTVTTHGYNLSSDDGSGYLTGPGDQINTCPLLGPLEDNGGPTFTHALLPGSPAINAGDPSFTPPPNYDQRGPGFNRVANGGIDVGSFEAQPAPAPSPGAVFNTGVDPNGTPLAGGSVDLHWSIVAGPGITCPTNAFVLTDQLPGTYAQSSVSRWVWGSNSTGTYTFRLTFDLTGFDPASVSISGSWGVNNFGSILVNGSPAIGVGTLTLSEYTTDNFNVFHDFAINGNFVPGINTLDFVTTNIDDSLAALNVTNLTLINSTATPTPTSTPTATATPTSTPTATATPTFTPTAIATFTPTTTPTATAATTATPTPTPCPMTWTQLSPNGTGPDLNSQQFVSDGQGNLIMFGGCGPTGCNTSNTTFVLRHAFGVGGTTTWVQLATSGGPPGARHGHVLAYDSNLNELIVSGGCAGGCLPLANDMWSLSNANGLDAGTPTWTNRGSAPNTSFDNGQFGIVDSTNHVLMIFGGQNGFGSACSTSGNTETVNTSTFSVATLATSGGPPGERYFPHGGYDPISNRLIISHGSSCSDNDLWVLTNANGTGGPPTWSNILTQGGVNQPPVGPFPSTYSPELNTVFLLEQANSALPPNLWQLSNASGFDSNHNPAMPVWSQTTPTGAPASGSIGGPIAYDYASNRLVVQVGLSNATQYWIIACEMPTPTPTATATFTPTPTATSTSTPTATATATFTPTATATFTPTTTATFTPTATATATYTPTPTATFTPTATATFTPTATATATATATFTPTPTPTPTPAPTCVPPPSGVVSWWPGDGNANDIIGSNNGTLANGATFASGKVDQAFSFNGSTQYVLAKQGLILGYAANFTISAWVRWDGGGSDGQQQVYCEGSFNDLINLMLVRNGNVAYPAFQTLSDSWRSVTAPTPINSNEWHHIAAVLQAGVGGTLYVDGQSAGTNPDMGPVSGNQFGFETDIGRFAGNGGSRYLSGFADELQVFNRAVSDSEIQSIFNTGSAGECKPTPTPTATPTFTPTATATATPTVAATFTPTATATFTPTPTPTATPTPTPTLTPCSVTPTGDLFASVNGNGTNGGGFIYRFNPTGAQSTFASNLSRPRGVTFDSTGNLFVATSFGGGDTFEGSVVKITPEGAQSTFVTFLGNYFLSGAALDQSGNLFVVALDVPGPGVTIYKVTPNGAPSTFATTPSIQSFGLAFDSAGFLYIAQQFETGAPEIWKFAPDGTSSLFATVSSPSFSPGDLAFDCFGNLFVSAGNGLGQSLILKYAPDGTESTFASGLNSVRGLAFDSTGNLFLADVIGGNILKFTPGGTMTVFASGNAGPEFLAFQLATPTPTPTPTSPATPTPTPTPTPCTAPATPTAQNATDVTFSSFSAHWSSVPGATGYRLDVSTNNSFSTYVPGYQNLDVGNMTSYNVTGLSANTTYFYRVRAYNGCATSRNSNVKNVKTLPCTPAAPTAQNATDVTFSSFSAHWSTVNGTIDYRLDVATDSSFINYVSGYQNLSIGNVTTFPVTGLTANTTYYYRIRAYNGCATSPNSNVKNVRTLACTPVAPTAQNATNVTAISLNAHWSTVNGAIDYRLDIATDSSFINYVSGYQNLSVGNVTSFPVTGLSANTTYYYRVRAYNGCATSPNSNVIKVKTKAH